MLADNITLVPVANPSTGVVSVGLVKVLLVNVCVLERVTTSTPSTVITPAAERAIVVSEALPSSIPPEVIMLPVTSTSPLVTRTTLF